MTKSSPLYSAIVALPIENGGKALVHPEAVAVVFTHPRNKSHSLVIVHRRGPSLGIEVHMPKRDVDILLDVDPATGSPRRHRFGANRRLRGLRQF